MTMLKRAALQTIFLGVLLITGNSMHAQFGKNCEIRQLKINLISPGLEYEAGIGVNSTLNFKLAVQPAIDPSDADPYSNLDVLPAFMVQYRLYHNFENRYRNGRFIYGNSGNYLAPAVAVFSSAEDVSKAVYGYAGLVYGLQRSFGAGFSIGIDAGAAYHVGAFSGGIYPVLNLGIGWIVSEKRWCVGR